MRSKSWRQDLDEQATLDAYAKALRDGAKDLAQRIRVANSGIDLNEPDLTEKFKVIDKQYEFLTKDSRNIA